jgi:hypothetical protein
METEKQRAYFRKKEETEGRSDEGKEEENNR